MWAEEEKVPMGMLMGKKRQNKANDVGKVTSCKAL